MDVEQIAPHLWHWSTRHPDWKPEDRGESGLGWDEIVSSYALVPDDALVLIDPQVPADEAEAGRFWEALDRDVEGHGPPAILITIFWHARSAEEIAARYPGSTIWAPADAPEGQFVRHIPTPPATSSRPASAHAGWPSWASSFSTGPRIRRSCSATSSSTASACSPKAGFGTT